MKDVDDRYSRAYEASNTSTDTPNLQAVREILHLESLYGDEVYYKSHMRRPEPKLQAMREILYLESLYGAAVESKTHAPQTELGTVLSVIFSIGFLFLVGTDISVVLHWALQLGIKACGH